MTFRKGLTLSEIHLVKRRTLQANPNLNPDGAHILSCLTTREFVTFWKASDCLLPYTFVKTNQTIQKQKNKQKQTKTKQKQTKTKQKKLNEFRPL